MKGGGRRDRPNGKQGWTAGGAKAMDWDRLTQSQTDRPVP